MLRYMKRVYFQSQTEIEIESDNFELEKYDLPIDQKSFRFASHFLHCFLKEI